MYVYGEIDNEDAKGGDQLGLFGGTGKKKVVGTKYKQDKPQGDAKQDVMFERMDDDPDQQTLFSTFGEATARYQAGLKKKHFKKPPPFEKTPPAVLRLKTGFIKPFHPRLTPNIDLKYLLYDLE